jgi:hypothetical protein
MSDKSVYLAIRVSKHGHGEACLCSSREEAEKKLFEVVMTLYAHEHATIKAAKNYSDLSEVVSKQTGLPFKIRIIETNIEGTWFQLI